MIIFELFYVFFYIGLLTFGGGYAMVPLLQRELVEDHHWLEKEEVVDVFAIVQSLPGVIAINSSIFVGYRIAGLIGALFAAVGMVLPSLIVIAVISGFYIAFRENRYVAASLLGIRVGVVALMVFAMEKLGKPSIKDAFCWVLAIVSFIVVAFFTSAPVWLVLLCGALLGLMVKQLSGRKKEHQNV
jgi:chromate transporter